MKTSYSHSTTTASLPYVRKSYTRPALTVHGTVEQLTLGGENGVVQDQNFKGFNNRKIGEALALS